MAIKQVNDGNTTHDIDNRSVTLSSTSGTLTDAQLAILKASQQNYIINGDGYIFRLVAPSATTYTYQRWAHASKKSQICTVTLSTKGYVFGEVTYVTTTDLQNAIGDAISASY